MSKSTETKKHDLLNDLNEDIFIAFLKRGVHEYLNRADIDEYETDTLSEICEKRILRAIKKEARHNMMGRMVRLLPKIAAILLIIVAVCTVMIMSVEAFRVPVLNLFINSDKESTDFSLREDTPENIYGSFDGPAYIPVGYELVASEELGTQVIMTYTNSLGETMRISRFGENSSFGIDTENAETGEVLINGYSGIYSIKNGITLLAFRTDNYAYLINAPLELSEVLNIADSISE